MTRSRYRHAQLHLPVLSPDQALVLVNILERLVSAVWRAHGDAMAARLDELSVERAARTAAPPPCDDDILF